jgi:uncharacterized protein (DUF427 family)
MAYIDIAPAIGRVVVRWRGHVVVDTEKALELREGSYPPVLYVPREDADMRLMTPSPRHTTCPHKGEASYFNLSDPSASDDNAVWCYETPKPEVAAIAGRLAFYPDKVEISRNPS